MAANQLRFSIVLGQRLPWHEMLAHARETETLGFDGLFLVDHFFGRLDVHEPTHEGYTMLAALAPFTQNLRLGLMVAGNTYRNPMFLLKQAITVDHISGGRVDFGVGAGWVEREHEAYSYDFPAPKERVDRFAEALDVWDLLQRESHTTFNGRFYQLLDAPFEPKSLQGRLPVLIGGSKPRMLRLTAKYADIWNCTASPETGASLNRQLDEACLAIGRDPSTLTRSISPELNLLASVETFADGVEAYREAGFTDIFMPWPRNETEVPIMRAAAATIMPRYKVAPASHGQAPVSMILRPLTAGDGAVAAQIRADVGETADWAVIAYLIDHPDQLADGNAIAGATGLPSHADVTRAFANLAAVFERHGIARPWLEGPRGRTLRRDMAGILGNQGD